MSRYPFPYYQVDEQVFDANDGHFAFADSVEAAAIIVNLANTSHAAAENTRRYLERAQRERSVL